VRNKNVVIINDDKESLGDLEEILALSGHDSVVVNDALLAVDAVVQNKPDVVLLELKMPHKNGFELADEINRIFHTKRIPIIAMSAFFKDEFRFLFELCGIRRYFKKPFNPLDVIWAIENATEENN
jgi:two-component system response regulator AdeR